METSWSYGVSKPVYVILITASDDPKITVNQRKGRNTESHQIQTTKPRKRSTISETAARK